MKSRMARAIFTIFGAISALIPSLHAYADSHSPVAAFMHVNVVPMDKDTVLRDHSVIVRNGRIVEVGPNDRVSVPSDAQIIEGAGHYLMPGLADMHTHTEDSDEFIVLIYNGITTIRNMFGDSLHLSWKKQIENTELPAPTIYTAGPIIDGASPIHPGSDIVESPEQADFVVSRQKEAGYDFLKIYWGLTPEAFDAIMSAAKAYDMTVVGHVPWEVGLEQVLESNLKSIEHLTGYEYFLADTTISGEDISIWAKLDTSRFHRIAARTAEAEIWNCPTLILYQKRFAVGEDSLISEELARPEMKYISPDVKESFLPANNYLSMFNPKKIAGTRASDPVRKQLVKSLHDAGAGLLLGTDYPNPFVVPGFSLMDELANFVDAGLSPFEAIRAGTSDAARFLDKSGEFGTVTAGCRADLILVEDNPLDDVSNIRRKLGVMLRGRWLDASELDAMLEDLASRFADQDISHPTGGK